MKIILSWEIKRKIHRKHPDLLLCFLFTVVFKDLKKSVFSNFACLDAKKYICVGRKSNPGQLLGRQLCSPSIPSTRGWLILHFHFDPSENYLLQWSTCLTNKLQTNTVSRLLNKILVKVEIVFYWFRFHKRQYMNIFFSYLTLTI